MADPIKWRSKILLAKIAVSYGDDPAPTGPANAILATNIVVQPMEGQDVSRDLERPFLGAQPSIPASLHARLSFRVEMVPSGTAGTAPGWGPLLRACACAQVIDPGVSVTYNPVTDAHESVSLYLWIGRTLYVLNGARGNATMRFTAQGIPYLEFDFTGLWTAPSEVDQAVPTLTAFQKPDIASSANTPTFTIGGIAMVMRSFALALGNDVQPRFLVGQERILTVDRADAITTQVEALPLSGTGSWNPFAVALSQTPVAVSLVHGTVAGRIATIAVPGAQVQRPAGLENAQDIKEWNLSLTPLPITGNDQWTLTLT